MSLRDAIDGMTGYAGSFLNARAYRKVLTLPVIASMASSTVLDVLRGRTPWPHGKLKGQKPTIVTEDKHGRRVFIVLNPTARPDEGRQSLRAPSPLRDGYERDPGKRG